LDNVRSAVRYFAPQAIVDWPRLDTAALEGKLREQTDWLTPESVAGFDEKDLSILPDLERVKLAKLVADFQAVASQADPDAPPPDTVMEKGLRLFLEIVRLLEFDRYGDAEAFRVGKLIERETARRKTPEIAEIRFNTGLDHSGDPGLWIWVFLTEDVSRDDETFLKSAQRLRALLDPVARRVSPDRWPYLSFRPIAEPAEAMEAP
jgi:hypothetical protein